MYLDTNNKYKFDEKYLENTTIKGQIIIQSVYKVVTAFVLL